MRTDGTGDVLRDGVDGAPGNGLILDTLASLHQSLNAGDFGKWLLTMSGVLLLTNLLFGLTLAWPRPGTWQKALVPPRVANRRADLYSFHRALGLWVALPALLLVGAGLCLLHKSALEGVMGGAIPAPTGFSQGSGIGPGRALEIAFARYPGSTLTMMALPEEAAPWYRVRLHAPDESPRLYGATTLFVSAVDGSILQRYDLSEVTFGRVFIDGLYPFHTGALGGIAGRLLLFAVGIVLTTLIVYGLRMAWARR
jgi:uncharacterized iron-regulated membrane protein